MTTLEAVRAESLRMTAAQAVRRVTAFRSGEEMLAAMRGGYCPTLPVKYDPPVGVAEGRDNHAVRLVRVWVLAAGFSYFDGRRVVRSAE